MNKIIIVLIILVGNFVNLYYMGQNAEKESEQEPAGGEGAEGSGGAGAQGRKVEIK